MRNWKLMAGLVAAMALSAPVYAQKAKTLTAQDYAEIQQLYVRYAWSIDTHADNGMVYAKTFTPDGEFHVAANTVAGRDKLAAYNLTMGTANKVPTHFNANIMIEASPEGARGGCYLFIFGGEPNAKPGLNADGIYQDILVKTSEGWRFKQRTLYLNSMPPAKASSN